MANQVVTYDGVDVSEYFATWQESANARLNLVAVPRRHGALISDSIVQDARQIMIEGRIQETSDIAARNILDMLAELFSRQNKHLTLWDDRFINAYKAQFGYQYTDGGALCTIDFSVVFFCADPFWYNIASTGQGQTLIPNLTTSDIVIDVTNALYKTAPALTVIQGNFIAYPVWTIYATTVNLNFITVRNLSTGRQFTYIGTVIPGQAVVIDTAKFTVLNNGINDLTHWSGDFVWLDPSIAGGNSLQFEGTAPAAYSWAYTARTY